MSLIKLTDVNLVFQTRRQKRIKDILIPGSKRFNDFESSGAIHAIRDFNLEIRDKERVAVIGHNGAGKSTFLKMISNIYPPTSGEMVIEGKISSLFEFSTGFEMERSGWDNIYLRGLMLGETPNGIKAKMREIGEFSELGDFLNMPVKYYSSGMLIRLAFAVSTSINPDILLLDEAMAAGDASFIRKANERMRDMMNGANIMVLVTHSMETAKSLCGRCLWFERGSIVMDGSPEKVTEAYIKSTMEGKNEGKGNT